MNSLPSLAQAVSAIGFLMYGGAALTTQKMRAEFVRFGLPHLRVLTAVLQIAAGCGLLLGFIYPKLALLSSLGLSLMMVGAVGVRLKIKDPAAGFLQAFLCLLLNLYIFREQLLHISGRS